MNFDRRIRIISVHKNDELLFEDFSLERMICEAPLDAVPDPLAWEAKMQFNVFAMTPMMGKFWTASFATKLGWISTNNKYISNKETWLHTTILTPS